MSQNYSHFIILKDSEIKQEPAVVWLEKRDNSRGTEWASPSSTEAKTALLILIYGDVVINMFLSPDKIVFFFWEKGQHAIAYADNTVALY